MGASQKHSVDDGEVNPDGAGDETFRGTNWRRTQKSRQAQRLAVVAECAISSIVSSSPSNDANALYRNLKIELQE